jgi:hypothetical protein
MRFVIMHKTSARWEAGAIPGRELVARVEALLAELSAAGALLAGEGLRASSEGVRLTFAGGKRTVTTGPFEGANELPAGFTILRARSLNEAVEFATREAHIFEDEEIDIRPVTEPWDIGMAAAPANPATRRYMILRKATTASEAGTAPSAGQRAARARLIAETAANAADTVTETMRPSRRGRRYRNSRDGISMFDGPFIETKELLGGYIIVSAASLDDAGRIAVRYLETVVTSEVDVRELE